MLPGEKEMDNDVVPRGATTGQNMTEGNWMVFWGTL